MTWTLFFQIIALMFWATLCIGVVRQNWRKPTVVQPEQTPRNLRAAGAGRSGRTDISETID